MTTEKAFKSGSEFPAYIPGTIRLYSMRWCPYAQRSRIVLEHKNIKYEVVNIDLQSKPEWFLKDITSLGKVPALQIDDKIVYESVVVSEYIDELYPNNKLTPADPYQKARDAMLMETYSKAVMAFYKLFFNKEEDKVPEIVTGIKETLLPVDKELETRNTAFFGGDQPAMVDFMMWPHIERINAMNQLIPNAISIKKDGLPRLFGWIDRMLTVRAIKATAQPVEFYKRMMTQRKQGSINSDFGLEE